MEDRKKALELFAKQLSEGLPFAEDFLDLPDADVENNSLLARNLSEEALAHQVLKNTGVPIPGKGANKSQMEDFYHRIMQERYPELKPKIVTGDLKGEGAAGWYNCLYRTIALDENLHKEKGLPRAVGTLLHEAGHQYDDSPNVNVMGKSHLSQELDLDTLRKAKNSGMDLKSMDPAQVYEIYSKGHHAEIPNLREGSYGMGALKSMMKSGTFKQVAGALPVVGGLAAAAMSEDASAGVPVLGEANDVGESKSDEFQMLAEDKARKDYGQSAARMDALKKIGGK